jgi:hypothetical protein
MAWGKRIGRLMRAFIEEQWQRLESLDAGGGSRGMRARQEAMRELERDLRQPPAAPAAPIRRRGCARVNAKSQRRPRAARL